MSPANLAGWKPVPLRRGGYSDLNTSDSGTCITAASMAQDGGIFKFLTEQSKGLMSAFRKTGLLHEGGCLKIYNGVADVTTLLQPVDHHIVQDDPGEGWAWDEC
jgi:hypothetical protein